MNKKIAICGVGRLGLPLALNFDRVGFSDVVGYDVNSNHISSLNDRVFDTEEPEVKNLLNTAKVRFTNDAKELSTADFIVACVRTDSLDSGAYDLKQLWELIETMTQVFESANRLESKRALAINCNVNPGTSRMIASMLEPHGIEVYFWPEWVKQGCVVYDQTHPEVSILGTAPEYQTLSMVKEIISKLNISDRAVKLHEFNLMDAELAKISLNCFLTVKISFANMIGTLLDEIGIDAAAILSAIGEDSRIGAKFFQPGFGYGGPCLPRDNAALMSFASNFGIELPLCIAADKVNTQRRQSLLKSAVRTFHQYERIPEIDHISYKKGVPIFTESQQLEHVAALVRLAVPTVVIDEDDLQHGRLTINPGSHLLRGQNEQ